MVKLTVELIQQTAQYYNPCKDRELDLRGFKIPVIENLGGTLDQFDCIDLSDNEIRKLDGFPLLSRLKWLMLNNNRVCRIGEKLHENLPHLNTILLTNNAMQELGDLDPLQSVKSLTMLSLLGNPVTTKKQYRLYVIHTLPQLRILDFRKIKKKERDAAAKLFKGKEGRVLAESLGVRSKVFIPGAGITDAKPTNKLNEKEYDSIKKAISNAKTLEEVERLNQMLRAGQIPNEKSETPVSVNGKAEVEEQEEEVGMEEDVGAEEKEEEKHVADEAMSTD